MHDVSYFNFLCVRKRTPLQKSSRRNVNVFSHNFPKTANRVKSLSFDCKCSTVSSRTFPQMVRRYPRANVESEILVVCHLRKKRIPCYLLLDVENVSVLHFLDYLAQKLWIIRQLYVSIQKKQNFAR